MPVWGDNSITVPKIETDAAVVIGPRLGRRETQERRKQGPSLRIKTRTRRRWKWSELSVPLNMGKTAQDLPPPYEQVETSQATFQQNNSGPSHAPYSQPQNQAYYYPQSHSCPQGRPQNPQFPPMTPQFGVQYPPNYFCSKCHNTGIKLSNGSPCGQCQSMFGVQRQRVMSLAPGHTPCSREEKRCCTWCHTSQ